MIYYFIILIEHFKIENESLPVLSGFKSADLPITYCVHLWVVAVLISTVKVTVTLGLTGQVS